MTRVVAILLVFLVAVPAAAQPPAPVAAPDLTLPAWDLCAGPDRSQMACFTQAEVGQLLRLQEAARYNLSLTSLHLQLEAQLEAMITELQAAQQSYAALRAVIEERNTNLTSQLVAAQNEAERYRARAERRRIWPWVALGFGLITGVLAGAELAR